MSVMAHTHTSTNDRSRNCLHARGKCPVFLGLGTKLFVVQ